MSSLLRRLEILQEIRKLQSDKRDLEEEINQIRILQEEFGTISAAILEEYDTWVETKNSYMKITLAPIQVETQLEGDTAETFAGEVLPVIADMNTSAQQMRSVVSGITDLVSLLDREILALQKQIERLNEEIASLKAQLGEL